MRKRMTYQEPEMKILGLENEVYTDIIQSSGVPGIGETDGSDYGSMFQ